MTYHLFEGKGVCCLFDENGEIEINGSKSVVNGYVVKRLPIEGTTIFYYKRSTVDGITFVNYAKWVGKPKPLVQRSP